MTTTVLAWFAPRRRPAVETKPKAAVAEEVVGREPKRWQPPALAVAHRMINRRRRLHALSATTTG